MIKFKSYVGHNFKNFKRKRYYFQNEKNLHHDIQIIIFSFVGFTPITSEELREAVKLWITDESEALKKYGHISYWETQYITDMKNLFKDAENFNDDTCDWHTKMRDLYNSRYDEWIRLESK